MKTFIKIAVIVALFAGFIILEIRHDAAQEAAYAKYEQCVATQYHTTPAAYYQEHGVAPDCN